MTYNEISKGTSKWLKVRGSVNVFRGAFGVYNTRGEIAEEIHGDAGAKVTRKDMEDRFGTKINNNFTETDKDTSNFTGTSKSSSNLTELSKGSSDWSET